MYFSGFLFKVAERDELKSNNILLSKAPEERYVCRKSAIKQQKAPEERHEFPH